MSVCFSCKKKIDAVALTNLVYSFEPINDELVQVGWHKECYLAAQQSVQRIWGTVAQNEDLPNEKMCVTCGHSESRHQTAGGFCKHCTCNEFVDPATTPNR